MARKPTTSNKSATLDPAVLPNSLQQGITTKMPASGRAAGVTLSNQSDSYLNKSLSDIRSLGTYDALRKLARVHGDVSTAVSAMVRLANTPVRIRAYDSAHQLSPDGTALVRSIVARINNTSDYTVGFDDRASFQGVTEALLREVPLTGACALELVLDENRLPYRLQPVSPSSLKWRTGKQKLGKQVQKLVPFQTIQGAVVELDFPTFFYAAMDQDPQVAYPVSPLEPALITAPFHAETIEDVRRVVRRSGHSRLTIKLVTEQLMKSAPMEIKADPAKLQSWMDDVRSALKNELENLSPEMALVFYDTMEANYLNSELGAKSDYTPFVEMVDGLQSTSLKTPPSVLGKRMGGSQNTSSTESLLFIKTAAGIQPPVKTILERALTLAVRLFGFEGYVTCEFDAIDLRPDVELEAFKTMRQQRILEQLSYGFITDDEAAELLNTGPRAPGAPPLSGTMFTKQGTMQAPNPNSDPARRALTTDTPSAAGGKSNKSS